MDLALAALAFAFAFHCQKCRSLPAVTPLGYTLA